MSPTRAVSLAVLLVVAVGLASLAVADSPYDPNVVSERNPFAPERPAAPNATTVRAYAVSYEERRLYNDLLSSRGYTVDRGDEVRASCAPVSLNRTDAGRFRVRLRCRGDVDDAMRLFEPGAFAYRVTYLLTENETRQVGIENYPLGARGTLRPRPPSAESR